MSTPLTVQDPALTGDLAVPQGAVMTPIAPAPSRVGNRLAGGAAVLAASLMAERGAGFLGNILAARFAGASVFGAYALGISTANNISAYAAGGIGATATRFSGKYNLRSGGYGVFARVLLVVALVSAGIASVALWAGAAPIARLLHKPELVHLLQWASLSAAGMILLESARGFFIGQQRLVALGVLSVLAGVGMVVFLPMMAATHRPTGMIVVQGGIAVGAVVLCLLLAKPLGLFSPASAPASPRNFGWMLREVWTFGLVQLVGLLSANVAGWWLTALVARGDTSLVQMGFFAIASQCRNLTGVVPALLTESSYAVMADADERAGSLPDRVMALCTYASITTAYLLAGAGMLVAPWLLHLLYGSRYQGAATAAAVGMAVAVLQMGNAPPSARMSIVSVRWVAAGNTGWALLVAAVGTLWFRHGGSATQAMVVFLIGHTLLSTQVLAVLGAHRHLPDGVAPLFVLSTVGVVVLACLAAVRARHPEQSLLLTALMLGVFAASTAFLLLLGRRHNWLVALARPVHMVASRARQVFGWSAKAEVAA